MMMDIQNNYRDDSMDQPNAIIQKKKINVNQSILFKLNKKTLHNVFTNLRMKDLSTIRRCCKRLDNLIQDYVEELQVILNEEHHPLPSAHLESNRYVILYEFNPDRNILYNQNLRPPFQRIKKLFLNVSEENDLKINLVQLTKLTHLKIRGMFRYCYFRKKKQFSFSAF